MPDINADQILTFKHKREFVQFGGAEPGNSVRYQGSNAQFLMIESASVPELGGVEPIWNTSKRIGKYNLVGRQASPPELPTATIVFREKHGAIPRQLLSSCPFNIYEVSGKCADLSDFLNGWDDYVLIYENAIVTEKDLGQRTAWDTDEAVQDSLGVTCAAIFPIGALNFGEVAAPEITTEVADVVYGSNLNNCLGCNWGDQYVYAVTKTSGAGSPGYPVEVIYSVDGGQSWSQVNIDGFGATEEAYAIRVVGKYLVVLGDDAYYYAEIDKNSGVPGTFSKVTTGFVAGNSPKDMYVADTSAIFFVGDNGYIYKSTSITAGVSVSSAGGVTTENLARAKGYDDSVVVAVGASGAIVMTTNGGSTWALITSPDDGLDYQAVEVLSNTRFYVGGASTARVYYTNDGGASWTEVGLGVTTGDIEDILFVTDSVGYVSVTDTSSGNVAYVYATWNGGYSWAKDAPRLTNFPTFDRANRLAIPDTDEPGYASNRIAIAGLAGDGSDGVLYLGIAPIV